MGAWAPFHDGISRSLPLTAYMALALESVSWGTAEHWMRIDADAGELRPCAGTREAGKAGQVV